MSDSQSDSGNSDWGNPRQGGGPFAGLGTTRPGRREEH